MDSVSARMDLHDTKQEKRPAPVWGFFWAGLSMFVALLGITLAHVLPVTPHSAGHAALQDGRMLTELREQRLALEALRQEIAWMAAAQRSAPSPVRHARFSAAHDAQVAE